MFPIKINGLGKLLGQDNKSEKTILNACIDSRSAKPGDLFFALPGCKVDGHAFLSDAAGRGALAAIVSKNYLGDDFGLELFHVEDVLATLQELARVSLSHHRPKIVAITGSMGKTTTKDFTAALLRAKYIVNATSGNSNTKITLPQTILNRQGKEDVLVLEMGMTHEGNLRDLVSIAPPDLALITTVGLVHAVNFQDLEHIARAKSEIFSNPNTRVGIYNALMPHHEIIQQAGQCRKVSFAFGECKADYAIRLDKEHAIISHHGSDVFQVFWVLPGKHNLQNYIAAVSIAHQLGVAWQEIKDATSKLVLPAMRMQRIEKKGVTFINDAYNANRDSMFAALSSLPVPKPGRKRIAVLGDMRELGRFSEDCHKDVGKMALEHVDRLFCLGEGCIPMANIWKRSNRPVDLFDDRTELLSKLREEAEAGDVILLKGSKVHSLWLVVEEY